MTCTPTGQHITHPNVKTFDCIVCSSLLLLTQLNNTVRKEQRMKATRAYTEQQPIEDLQAHVYQLQEKLFAMGLEKFLFGAI